jgi:valacyclovir hydrolase
MMKMSMYGQSDSRIYFEQDGQGDPVLVLPGWGGGIGEFDPIRKALSSHFRVIAADLPGSGQSEPQPREYTSSYFHDDAGTFLAMLDDLDASPAHLVGFSDGGEIALLMAVMRPDAVRSVVTWGAAGQLVAPPGMLEAFYQLVDDPIPPLREFAAYLNATYGEDNARAMAHSESDALRAIIEAGGDLSRSRASGITCPALLVTGEHDPFCPPALVSELAEAIPRGEFVKVDEVGHDVHTARPQWLAETLTRWLERHRVEAAPTQAMSSQTR